MPKVLSMEDYRQNKRVELLKEMRSFSYKPGQSEVMNEKMRRRLKKCMKEVKVLFPVTDFDLAQILYKIFKLTPEQVHSWITMGECPTERIPDMMRVIAKFVENTATKDERYS